jgi:hypothetical protein
MWESRVLCEISKSLWKPFCGFHRDVISTAIFDVAPDRADLGDAVPLSACRSSFLALPTRSFSIRDPCKRSRAEDWEQRGSTRMVYFVTSSDRKSVWTLVRQLLGPHLRTCA